MSLMFLGADPILLPLLTVETPWKAILLLSLSLHKAFVTHRPVTLPFLDRDHEAQAVILTRACVDRAALAAV